MNAVTKTEAAPPNVYQRLNLARKKFHALELKKSGKNTFAGYSYFELGDFIIPALDIFDEVGLCAIISFGSEYATMEIVAVEDSGTPIVIRSPMGSASLKGCHEVQNIGAVETYQRRYLWVTALEIVEHDALDATTGAKGKEPDTKAISNAEWTLLVQLVETTNTNTQALCEAYKVASLKDLTADQYADAKRILEARLKKQAEATREKTDA